MDTRRVQIGVGATLFLTAMWMVLLWSAGYL